MKQFTLQQLVYSGLFGGVGMGGYLIVSNLIDKRFGYDWANFVGLLVAFIIDFYLQQLVFVGKITNEPRFWWKYSLAKGVETIISQILFAKYISYVREKNPEFYHQQIRKRILLIRYSIQLLIFVVITFPMRKYFIYV